VRRGLPLRLFGTLLEPEFVLAELFLRRPGSDSLDVMVGRGMLGRRNLAA